MFYRALVAPAGALIGGVLVTLVVGIAHGDAWAEAAPPPPPAPAPLPDGTGGGRRVVYDMGKMHVWLVENDGSIVRDYPVSGHKFRKLPGVGEFWVYSRSRYTGVKDSPTRMEFMVRFAVGESGAGIGFHSIPTKHGKAIEAESQLGTPFSHGCVRQSYDNAKFLFDWAPEGTKVVVVDTSGRVPAARSGVFPRGTRPMTPQEQVITTPSLLRVVAFR